MITPETMPVDMKVCMRTHLCPCCGKIALHAGHGVRGPIGNDECPVNFTVRCVACMTAKVEPDKDKYVLATELPDYYENLGLTFAERTIVFEVM